jgi:hypothetical protein
VQRALACTAGVVWLYTPKGRLESLFQINLGEVGIDASNSNRPRHTALLREVVDKAQPLILAPQSDLEGSMSAIARAGNPTAYVLLMVPILVKNRVQGIVEIFQDPAHNPNAQRGYLQFLIHVADLAARYIRNSKLREMVDH